jgi:hypothetical protein
MAASIAGRAAKLLGTGIVFAGVADLLTNDDFGDTIQFATSGALMAAGATAGAYVSSSALSAVAPVSLS